MGLSTRELARLRRDARDELSVLVDRRARNGEDPWEFMPELPTVDELVVSRLRDDALEREGVAAEYALARLAGHSSAEDAPHHRRNADALDYRLLREIGLAEHELLRTVWVMLGRLDPAARGAA